MTDKFNIYNYEHRRGLRIGEAMSDAFLLPMFDKAAARMALDAFQQYGTNLEPGSREERAYNFMLLALELLHDEACAGANGEPSGDEIHAHE